ncbi:NAD(P)/FAD-dependent oxidoreductase [Aliihoeflea sp. PC F10.4]
MQNETVDVAVIGGGLVGMATAYGLVRNGADVAVLDEGDVAHRASRGNFALIWVQGKGGGLPPYTMWTRRSASIWAAFAEELQEVSGVEVHLLQPGGFNVLLDEGALQRRTAMLQKIDDACRGLPSFPNDNSFSIVDADELRRVFPQIGPEVVGATYNPLDGHVNSLVLFRALHAAFAKLGGCYMPSSRANEIIPGRGGFDIVTPTGRISTGRVVLAAGIDNGRLGEMVGLNVPVRPQRGQVLITEKMQPFMTHPIQTLRQTNEGGLQIGDSVEEVGADTTVRPGVLSVLARRATGIFPHLKEVGVVRAWSALRVMTRDGYPIYDQSRKYPGAYVCTCHSGVTLAAVHATVVAPDIVQGRLGDDFAPFSAQRFDVSATA